MTVATKPMNGVSNEGAPAIIAPYTVMVRLQGQSGLLFHRWDNDAVAAKSAAGKNTTAKKTDNVESYLYRDDDGHICLPGRYLQRAIIEAGRFHQDPRSPRKSAFDLLKAAQIVSPDLAPMLVNGQPTNEYDYLDRQRAVVQRSAITRERPAFRTGWEAEFEITVILPEYISPVFLRTLVDGAGKFIGVADMRPTYGRFAVVQWEIMAGE